MLWCISAATISSRRIWFQVVNSISTIIMYSKVWLGTTIINTIVTCLLLIIVKGIFYHSTLGVFCIIRRSMQKQSDIQFTEYYDLGVDIIAKKDGITWGVQVKHYQGLVSIEAVRQVVVALKKYKYGRD